MLLQIRGRRLAGPDWYAGDCPRRNIHCGLQVGRDAHELVLGGAAEATWTVDLRVQPGTDGAPDFKGVAVQGKRGERFVYLTWGELDGDEFRMFRRAKLMLNDLVALFGDGVPDVVIADVDLTDDAGGPRCARLKPPALTLSVG